MDILWRPQNVEKNLTVFLDVNWIMSNKLGDFSKFCGLLKISELYQVEDGISNSEQGTVQSEAFILTSTNPQYDKRLFIDLPVQYMKTTSSEHVVNINCQNKNKKTIFCHIVG